MPALIFLVIATAGENLFGFLSQLAYNSGILSKFAIAKEALVCFLFSSLSSNKSVKASKRLIHLGPRSCH